MLTTKRKIAIEWGDCDPAEIVFFPRYFAYFDACTAGLFERAGLPMQKVISRYGIIGVPMVDVQAKFLIPSRFGDEVIVETTITDFRKSSFHVRHRLFKGEELAVECLETRVWTGKHPEDSSRLKGKPIPEEVIARFKDVEVNK